MENIKGLRRLIKLLININGMPGEIVQGMILAIFFKEAAGCGGMSFWTRHYHSFLAYKIELLISVFQIYFEKLPWASNDSCLMESEPQFINL